MQYYHLKNLEIVQYCHLKNLEIVQYCHLKNLEIVILRCLCNRKLSICRCTEWRYGKCAFVPWCKDSDTLPAIHEDQADIILLGNVVGLHRTNLY